MELNSIIPSSTRTHFIVVLDESGSMSSRYDETTSGFNKLVKDQADGKDDATISLWTFNDQVREVYGAKPLSQVAPLDAETYKPGGYTALHDALGVGLTAERARLSALPADQRPAAVLVTVITDGAENSSRIWRAAKTAELIQTLEAEGWIFTYLGCTPGGMQDAQTLGFSSQLSAEYAPSSAGVAAVYTTMSNTLGRVRSRARSGLSVGAEAVAFTTQELESMKGKR